MSRIKRVSVMAAAVFLMVSVVIGIGLGSKDTVEAAGGEFTRTAIEIAGDMGYGWNLGNTMEAINTWTSNPTVRDFETAWGQPVTTKAMITGVKNAGFDSIRIPVSWSNMMSNDGNYTISSAYFDRVDEIIGYAMDNDMYVIINIHWDGGWWDNFKTNKTESMKKYKAMWTQIATHYKNYSEKLIFESANEELGDNMGYATVNEVNQAFVDVVRTSGGYNDKRYLLIAGYNTDIDKTCSSSFKMPQDVISNHLMISVHYYTPWTYVGLYKDEGYGYKDTWGTTADKTEMANYLKKMTKFTDAGYGVVIGEYSVIPQYTSAGNYNRKNGDITYISYLLQLCDTYGYAPYLWDTGDWYDRAACKLRWDDIAALFKDGTTPSTPATPSTSAAPSETSAANKPTTPASQNNPTTAATSKETVAPSTAKETVAPSASKETVAPLPPDEPVTSAGGEEASVSGVTDESDTSDTQDETGTQNETVTSETDDETDESKTEEQGSNSTTVTEISTDSADSQEENTHDGTADSENKSNKKTGKVLIPIVCGIVVLAGAGGAVFVVRKRKQDKK